MRTAEGSLWKLKKCLYKLNDGARNFFRSVKQNLLDPAILYFKKDNDIQGIICCHVDDFLHAGTKDFEQSVIDTLRSRFTPGKIEQNRFRYIGFDINIRVVFCRWQYTTCLTTDDQPAAQLRKLREEALDCEISTVREEEGAIVMHREKAILADGTVYQLEHIYDNTASRTAED